jgi:hypothetical protein
MRFCHIHECAAAITDTSIQLEDKIYNNDSSHNSIGFKEPLKTTTVYLFMLLKKKGGSQTAASMKVNLSSGLKGSLSFLPSMIERFKDETKSIDVTRL